MIKMYVARSAPSSYLLCPAVLGGSWKRGCSEGLPTVAVEDCGKKRGEKKGREAEKLEGGRGREDTSRKREESREGM